MLDSKAFMKTIRETGITDTINNTHIYSITNKQMLLNYLFIYLSVLYIFFVSFLFSTFYLF